MDNVRNYPKFLISIDSFFCKEYYIEDFRLIYYCNIRLSYRIRKVVGNISINILSYEGKKLLNRDRSIKTITR